MGKSKGGGKAPPPPDPIATAAAQSQYNQQAAITQANLNRIDQVTPQGSITYSQHGTNSDGTPQYTQTQTYSPQQQALYDQQNQIAQALGGTAQDQIGRVNDTMNTPFNYNGMQPLTTNVNGQPTSHVNSTPTLQSDIAGAGPIQRGVGPTDLAADGQRVADAVYGQATSRLDPQWKNNQNDFDAKMAAQGIPVGSEAYNRIAQQMSNEKNDAYNQANYSAIQAGGNEQSRLFGMALNQGQFANQAQDQQYTQNAGDATFHNQAEQQGFGNTMSQAGFNNQAGAQDFNQNLQSANLNNNSREQQIQEATYLRNLPLNDIAALLGTGGGVQNPQFSPFAQVGVAAPDYMGQVNNTYADQYGQYQQQQKDRSAGLGAIFGLAGQLAPLAFSDARLKENVVRIGKLANGLATYAFNYIGGKVRQFGVMAQEALQIVPDAVSVPADGYMTVDYGKVW
jgi:hypothetical protein